MEINEFYWDKREKRVTRSANQNTMPLMKIAIEARKGELLTAMIMNLSENITLMEMSSSESRFKALVQCMIMNCKLIALGCDNDSNN